MAKKKNKSSNNAENEAKYNEDPVNKDGGDDEQKREKKNVPLVVVLKVEMDCEGCASKMVKLVRSFEGVESAKVDLNSNKITLMGNVNPLKIKENLHNKTKKKVDLVSPQVKKDDSNDNENTQNDKKSGDNKKQQKQSDNTVAKKAPVSTAVLKMSFHCQGCVEKIHKTVSKTKGVEDMAFDKQKETVTVKGTMDVKALVDALKERLRRPVEIVPPKKEKEGEDNGGESGGGGGGGKGGGKGKNGGHGGKDNGDAQGGGGGQKMEMLMQSGFGPGYGFEPVYGYAPFYGNGFVGYPPPHYQPRLVYPEYGYGYGYGYVPGYPVHMKFNDENPNACSIM